MAIIRYPSTSGIGGKNVGKNDAGRRVRAVCYGIAIWWSLRSPYHNLYISLHTQTEWVAASRTFGGCWCACVETGPTNANFKNARQPGKTDKNPPTVMTASSHTHTPPLCAEAPYT